MYIVCTCMNHVCTCIYNVCTWYNQLSLQVFVADREMQMQDWGTSLALQVCCTGRYGWAVPVQKMAIFFMPDQMLQKQRSHQQKPDGYIAYNMGCPCTVYVHVYKRYVHVYAMYVRVLISCLNSHSEGVYRRYIPVYTMVDSCTIALYIPMSKAVQASMQWHSQ